MAGYLKEFDASRGGDAAHAAATVLASHHGPLTLRGGGASTHDAAVRMTHEAATTRMHSMPGAAVATWGPSGWQRIVSDTTGRFSADEKALAQQSLGKLRPRDTPGRLTDRVNAVLGRRAASSTMNKAATNSEVFKHRSMKPEYGLPKPGGGSVAPKRFVERYGPRVTPSM